MGPVTPCSPRHPVSVGAVVLHPDGQVLVVERHDNGRLATPGGVLELNETPAEAVAREVLEETGVHVVPEQLVAVHKNMVTGVLSLVFRCRPVGGTRTRISEETPSSFWMPAGKAREQVHEIYAARITDALTPGGPFVRLHDGERIIG